MTNPICPYCGKESELVTGRVIYPHRSDLYHLWFYRCAPCDAYEGCHPGSKRPLGRLANRELRQARMAAHRAFDPIWKSKEMNRSQAYAWLASRLGIEIEDCHIGMFDVSKCEQVVVVCNLKGTNEFSKQGR